ncbi:putative transport [Salmonella bongori]|nr:putative transport [Salmonella bongori]
MKKNKVEKKIEVDEDRLPSRAMAIHEHIRQDGEKEMERDAMALLWSAIAAGLSMGASLLAKGIFHVQLEGVPGGFFAGKSRLHLWLYYCHHGPPAIIY